MRAPMVIGIVGCLVMATAGCGVPDLGAVAEHSAALDFSGTLVYGGSCNWLKCAQCNSASGAFNLGCDDSIEQRIAIPTSGLLASRTKVIVCAGSRCTAAYVWDVSSNSHWEGNKPLMTALGIAVQEGTCNPNTSCNTSGHSTAGTGQAAVTISTCGNGLCEPTYGENTSSCALDCQPCEPKQSCTGKCGPQTDNCGGKYDCGFCCTPRTSCAAAAATCGTVDNGCGGTLNCGTCPSGYTCTMNLCECTATHDCSGLCGSQTDACGRSFSCGPCCTPVGCAGACGEVEDGCGGTLDCGPCDPSGGGGGTGGGGTGGGGTGGGGTGGGGTGGGGGGTGGGDGSGDLCCTTDDQGNIHCRPCEEQSNLRPAPSSSR